MNSMDLLDCMYRYKETPKAIILFINNLFVNGEEEKAKEEDKIISSWMRSSWPCVEFFLQEVPVVGSGEHESAS